MNQDTEVEARRAEFARDVNKRVLEAMHAEVDRLFELLFQLAPQLDDGGSVTLELTAGLHGYGDQATAEVTMRREYEDTI